MCQFCFCCKQKPEYEVRISDWSSDVCSSDLWVVAPMHSRFSGVEWPMFAVDSAAFAALYILSLISTRYWPAWMAAMQGCVALSHLSGLRLDIIPWAYGTVVAGWA